jgi:hypothetical protein
MGSESYDIIEQCGAPLSTVNIDNTDEESGAESEADEHESCTASVLDQDVHFNVSKKCVPPVVKTSNSNKSSK